MLKVKLNTDTSELIQKCNIGDALTNGTPARQYKIAKCLLTGNGYFAPNTRKIALKLLKKAADKGHVEAAYETYIQSLFKNWKETSGVKYLKFAAEKGHIKAQIDLARCYMYKKSMMCKDLYDPDKSFEILKELVKKTKDTAVYKMLGLAYETGKGTDIDLEQARKYYKKANTQATMFFTTKDIHRVDLLMNKPDKKQIAENNPTIYKLVKGELVAIL